MAWKRRSAPSGSESVSDGEVMGLLQNALAEAAPSVAEGSRVRDGMLVGPSGWALMRLPNHTGSPQHFDIGFVTSLESPRPVVLPDCISGLGSPHEAAAMMVRIWSETSGACFMEMLTRRGEYASHLDGSDSAGLPGWHSVVSGVLAYGPDSTSNDTLQAALVGHEVLRAVGPLLAPALDRPALNGIKVFYQGGPTSATAEIRVNGVAHAAATQALSELPWPAVAAPAIARFYAVAAHPA